MGDFGHEFSIGGVDTGRTTAPSTISVPSPTFNDPRTGQPIPGTGGQMPVTVPGSPIMRPSFLQAFLANLGPALAGGLMPTDEKHPFGTGLGGAMAGIQSHNQQMREYGLQAQASHRADVQAVSQQALQQAQLAQAQQATQQAAQLFPGQLQQQGLNTQEQQLNLKMRQGITDLATNPDSVSQITGAMTKSLGKISPDEQAQLDAAQGVFNSNLRQGKFDPTPIQGAVTKISQDRLESSKAAQNPEQQELKAWLAKNPGKDAADFMVTKAKLVPQFNFNLQNAGALGSAGKPSAIAQGIADGSIKWNDAVSARTPMNVKTALLAEVKGINPAFKASDFDVEKKVQEAFTSGAYSQQLNSISRAREHMQTFLDTAKDLDNGSVQAFNRIGNAFSVEFGSDKVGNLNIAKQAFASEVGKAFAGASVGVSDRQELDHQINAASSYSQLAGAARTADKLLAGAQTALKKTYESGIKGNPNFGQANESGPTAADLLKKYPPVPR